MEAILNSPYGRIVLGPTPLTIGRTPGNQLVVNDPKVSSHHADIRLDEQGYSIIDLGSSNGTFINEQRLIPHIPRLLQPNDIVRIGDTRLTYEGVDLSSREPTVYASPRQESSPGNPPPVIAPPPYMEYSPVAQQGGYPPPAHPEYSPMMQQGMYPPSPPVQAQKRSRRGLWIILGAIIGVLVIGAIIFGVIGYVNRSTPTKTLNAFCSALKGGDYQTAYNQLASGLQSKLGTEAQFAAGYSSNGGLGKITGCTVSNVNDSAGTGTISYTFATGSSLVVDYHLFDENGASRINSTQPHSTPSLTLATYCTALKGGDYQSAYNQFSSAIQSQASEAQFAAVFTNNKVTDCMVSNIDNAAGTGKVTYTYSSGAMLTTDETLSNQNGTWKISAISRTPTETLNAFCSTLKNKDYSHAYSQLSSNTQSQATEAQFAAQFNSTQVTNCTVSNVDDTAGTGTISYTFSDGSTSVIDYTLVNENGIWGINSGRQRPEANMSHPERDDSCFLFMEGPH